MSYSLLGALVFRDYETDGVPASGAHKVLKSDVRAWMLETERARTHGADIVAAATLNLDTATGDFLNVTGNTGISAVTLSDGQKRYVQFTGTPLITVGGSLVGNAGGANVQVQAGDFAIFEGYLTVVYFWLVRATGKPVVMPSYSDLGGSYPFPPTGQCQLIKSGANLQLNPYGGNLLMINAVAQPVPAAGVSLGVGGLVAATFYYVYAFMNGATMTLEAVTTVPVQNSTTGLMQKTGDATRTLVGAAYTDTGPAFADTDGKRFVLSWFNRLFKKSQTTFTANRTQTSTSFGELNAEIRNNFLSWAEEIVEFSVTGSAFNGTAGNSVSTGLGFDGTSPENDGSQFHDGGINFGADIAFKGEKQGLTEAAVHFATLLGRVSAGTGTWVGTASTAGQQQCYLTVKIRG
jgi:hypothetical protein